MQPKIFRIKSNKFCNVFFLLFFSFIIQQRGYAQQWSMLAKAEGNNQSSSDRDIAVDNQGNIFIAGYFTLTMKLGSFTLTNGSDYNSDMYLARLTPSGKVLWAKSIDLGFTYNYNMGLCLDDSDNLFITGSKNAMIFVDKYDSSGKMVWGSNISDKQFTGYGHDIGIDQYDNIYVTGDYSGNSILAKINSDGKFLWANTLPGNSSNGSWGNNLAVDRLGNCYVAGGFQSDSIILGDFIVRKSVPGQAWNFFAKYSPEGKVLWANSPVGSTLSNSLVALTENGNVICSGTYFNGQISFGENVALNGPTYTSNNAYIACYDTSGIAKWATDGLMSYGRPNDIKSVDNNIYLLGVTDNKIRLVKYNSDGDTIFVNDKIENPRDLNALDIDNNGNCYITGNINSVDFRTTTIIPVYSTFIAKFNTGATTHRLPNKPGINKEYYACSSDTIPTLTATGNNVKWYKDGVLKQLLSNSNSYTPAVRKLDTFYVTQTINNITSWPKQVILFIAAKDSVTIQKNGDSLIASVNSKDIYRWTLENANIPDNAGGNTYRIKAASPGNYNLKITDTRKCIKEASFFVAPTGVNDEAGCLNSSYEFVCHAVNDEYHYQWQMNDSTGFVDINDNEFYSGTKTAKLNVHGTPASFYRYQFRCVITYRNTQMYGDVYSMNFVSEFNGGVSSQWEDVRNWSCNSVPDSNVNVIIKSGIAELSTNTSVRSVTVKNGASVKVKSGVQLSTYTPTPDSLAMNLFAYYPFNKNGRDISGSQHHLTIYGATLTKDRFNKDSSAYYFNGIGQYMEIPQLATDSMLNEYTISLWVKAKTTVNIMSLLSLKVKKDAYCGSSIDLGQYDGPTVLFNYAPSSQSANSCSWSPKVRPIAIQDEEWMHIAVVVGTPGQYVRPVSIYLNGVLLPSTFPSGSTVTDLNPMPVYGGFIGRMMLTANYFNGTIDDIRIYKRSLTDSEVQKLYKLDK